MNVAATNAIQKSNELAIVSSYSHLTSYVCTHTVQTAAAYNSRRGDRGSLGLAQRGCISFHRREPIRLAHVCPWTKACVGRMLMA